MKKNFVFSTAVAVELIPSESLFVVRQINGALLRVCRDSESVRVFLDDLSSDLFKQHERVSDDCDIVKQHERVSDDCDIVDRS